MATALCGAVCDEEKCSGAGATSCAMRALAELCCTSMVCLASCLRVDTISAVWKGDDGLAGRAVMVSAVKLHRLRGGKDCGVHRGNKDDIPNKFVISRVRMRARLLSGTIV